MPQQPDPSNMIVFEPGDRVPDFTLPDVLGNTVGLYLSAVGKPIVLVACSKSPEDLLLPFAEASNGFENATVIFLTRGTVDQNRVLAERLRLPFPMLSDVRGDVILPLLHTDGNSGGQGPLATFTLDSNQRICRVDRGTKAKPQIKKALECLSEMMPRPAPVPTPRPAPLLHVPKVLDSATCRELIQVWKRKGNQATGTIDVYAKEVETFDDDVKIRRDHYIRDKVLLTRLSDVVGRRVAPEIEKAFCFRATRVEEFKIACYEGDTSGFFRPHKDNLSERTMHRRFAMSLLLTDPDEYEGGELRFLEYGPELYKPGAGDAVVFSCSLLHEVLPMTAGRRFVLLCFLFGEEEARMIEARKRR